MRLGLLLLLAGLACTAAFPAAAGSAKGIKFPYPAVHVATVEVTLKGKDIPQAYADGLKADALNEAALYGSDGAPLDLQIEVDTMHVKNAMKAMLIGDMNYSTGVVLVVDPATGQTLGKFKILATADRPGGGAMVLAMLDPTGLVAMSQAMSGTNRPHEELMMSANFAIESLRQTYGDARAKAAHAVKRPPPASAPAPAETNAATNTASNAAAP